MGKKKILFVCLVNMCRSVTAEEIFKDRYDTKSAGVSPFAEQKVTQQLLDWADVVVVMENYMKNRIMYKFKCEQDKIKVLNIDDIYNPMDDELIKILETKVPQNI